MSGLALAGVQVSLFSSAPTTAAMTATPDNRMISANTDVLDDPLQIGRSANGLFHVNGAVNGIPVRFAVDTGASVVVLNAADANRIGLAQPKNANTRIRTAAGFSRMHWQRGQNVAVEGKDLGPIDIAVMPDGPETSLLGLNALAKLESVTLARDTLTIK
ncbi:aspartyl protease family protein [Parasphingorhabdus marina DSM 22363]|uniref:Aspartyl protease family protein n=2 Tax=Parasphingorhabdus marina TaxID=394732 RepID=A0A1N6CP85_9SPHN|nr:aspartyl protease family protein [Parasphingorhabdus marina DSM 22363]